ncbi:bifunctional [glutamate--ammonia ligase]-adenylyl-L-tyrosine phosphorylase/[glutamate--ammonia-ligase] adenylyltransferase [Steroidobacter sp. S1-65]|uniref:Bifunctional glutamine synthetase adenylyltransferase/adenylyl-removing enzyme n=1 Tax=Steroidobacter gossypii TaxID=2805490 RepID=A0ABS1X2G6_9GAMM|nr:bifunctional [glutamate--ammonia ligase]-adenylyl-L-tyrosine phosphorylase/[glutamate--ammonia-ligase] adenylyltransferase [Steroidobacter gossypii]MBM0107416.1 bifunctional [glutamate--ammonia ligase]-adenylyl-L-tyrosine phosphorylase/[glutamate--ammonia-ligase] adenylyltransferase [Steroidobacter gossypii]
MTTAISDTAQQLLARTEARLAAAREDNPEIWGPILEDKRVVESLPRVWTCSEFVATSCIRSPALLSDLIANGQLFERAPADWLAQEIEARVGAELGSDSEADLMEFLRRFRRRNMVRIAWRDIAGWATLDETLHDLSKLADVCIDLVYRRMYAALVARYGTPRGAESGEAQPMMILGMGKLGGGELNFSSDIDLILLYPEDGETDGARAIDNAEFFLRLGQKIVQQLATPTVEGFVYRVDLRLRPFGDSGRLALSFASFEHYLQQHGRDWERYAYVKARALTSTEQFPSLYDEVLRPFVYRRYLDFSVFESLRDMKAMIAREVERRELKDNIKLGPGGIREIEFIVQAFQLIRGGSDRRLQGKELRIILPQLVGQRLLREGAVQELQAAYEYLRVLENRLQQWNDEQTHQLPEDAEARQRLAFAMNVGSWDELVAITGAHRQRVERYFTQTVFGPAERTDGLGHAVETFDVDADATERARMLESCGVAESEAINARLEELRTSAYYRRLDETGRRRLRELLARILPMLSSTGVATATLARILRIFEMIGGRTVYLALLTENAAALRRLVELCARSQFLADQIAAQPLLLDELIDERFVEEAPSRAQFAIDLAASRGRMQQEDPERQVEILRQFQGAATFRVAVADLTAGLPLMKVSDRLTDIAELIVQEALSLAWAQITHKHGVPRYVDEQGESRTASMIVVAYGKLGGLELGYGSDLDLVFLHDSSGESQKTDGAQSVENTVFFQRLGQRLVHLLTVHTASGRLYEVDTRLRPSGNRGLLVQSLAAFREYEFHEAWTWEHQSLLRARAIAGDRRVCEQFEQARIDVLRKAVKREGLKDEVRKMRQRMRDNLSKARPGQVDLKQDAGGVADLEFLVQYWMLEWADRYPEIVTFSDNIRQLESLGSGNLVPQARVDFLVDTYRKYRQRLHRLALDGAKNVVGDTEFVEERRGVVEVWQEVMREAGDLR